MISLLHNWEPTTIIWSIGSLSFYWYGLIVGLAILAGFFVSQKISPYFNIKKELIVDLSLQLVIGSIIGARIYEIFLEWPYYSQNPMAMFKIWQGGLAIHGAILAGLLIVYYFAKQKKLNFWALGGSIAPGLALGQAIGRWGNWFNQELFGLPTNLPWGIPISLINRPPEFINFEYFHPTFLYESLGNFLIFIILIIVLNYSLKKYNVNKTGVFILTVYMILYSSLRFGLEFIRLDPTPIIWGLRWPQIFSLLIITTSLYFFIKNLKNKKLS